MYMRAFSRNVKRRRGLESEQVLGAVYLGGCVSWGTGGLGADGWMSQATDELNDGVYPFYSSSLVAAWLHRRYPLLLRVPLVPLLRLLTATFSSSCFLA